MKESEVLVVLRRAIHLTLVSLVQTKYLPTDDTLFLPGSLMTGCRLHMHTAHTKRKRVHRQTKTKKKTDSLSMCVLCLCVYILYVYIKTSVYVCVCVHREKKFRRWKLTHEKYFCFMSCHWPYSYKPKKLLEDPGTCDLSF